MRFPSQEITHFTLRGRHTQALVQDEEDWHALSAAARRMLFWCGGSIYGCRCEGNEIRLAIQRVYASEGAIAHHISGAYAIHLRRRRGWSGSVFKHYIAIPIDGDLFLDDLVIWLHRPHESHKEAGTSTASCWTGDSAYLSPKSLTWIATERALAALSPGGAGRSAYIRRKTQPIDPETLAILTGRAPRGSRQASNDVAARRTPMRSGAPVRSIGEIARFVAQYSRISYEDMISASRKRDVSKAKVIATVLCARNGASVAAVARLFGRCRSTLIERADRYRETQPQLFSHAEEALERHLEREPSEHEDQSARLPQTYVDRRCARPARSAAIHSQAHAHAVED
jgi:transposase-like protein